MDITVTTFATNVLGDGPLSNVIAISKIYSHHCTYNAIYNNVRFTFLQLSIDYNNISIHNNIIML